MKEIDQSGGCACGAVRYTFAAPSTWCAWVHHPAVRRSFGVAAVAMTAVRFDKLTLTQGEGRLRPWEIPGFGRKEACDACGTPVLVRSTDWPEQVQLVSATLDGGPLRRPAANLFVDQKADWARLDDTLPGFGGPTGGDPLGNTDLRDRLSRVAPGVRLATPFDLFELADLYRDLAAAEWDDVPADLESGLARTLERHDHWILVADGTGPTGAAPKVPAGARFGATPSSVVGFCDIRRFPATSEGAEQLFIDDLWVAEAQRRTGVGRRLLDVVDWLATETGAVLIRLERRPDSEQAARFYEALGYEATDAVVMEKAPPPRTR
ncbi:MAG: GNAT family N-acetyltransferase [Myxococcales bacterium]|nr:GNAT family N-acetyltransferase [Myxococcales bacterium]